MIEIHEKFRSYITNFYKNLFSNLERKATPRWMSPEQMISLKFLMRKMPFLLYYMEEEVKK
jgi:hypothetical protein